MHEKCVVGSPKLYGSISDPNQLGNKTDVEGGGVLFAEERNLPKPVIALLVFSVISGAFCVVFGSLVRVRFFSPDPLTQFEASYDLNYNISFYLPPYSREAIKLIFNVIFVKPCVSVFNRVHGTATKWQVACENDPQTERFPQDDPRYSPNTRLEFNSNPHFLVSSHYSILGPTGLPANIVMSVCLAITYAASQMVMLEVVNIEKPDESVPNTVLSHFALHILGIVILIQAFISIWALLRTDIKTWNQTPFVTAYILSQEMGRMRKTPGRCMQSLYHRFRDSQGAVRPENFQVSPWDTHPIFRVLITRIWVMIGVGFYWGILMFSIVESGSPGTFRGKSWLPVAEPANSTSSSGTNVFTLSWNGVAPSFGLFWGIAVIVGFQGGIITTAMTCAQTILDLVCDQRLWEELYDVNGSDPKPHMLKKFTVCSHSYVIHLADPFFHWGFGLVVGLSANKGLQILPVPIFWVSVAGVAGAIYVTYVLKVKIKTSLPATFGHLQTMVDLIDEWHEKMYWGDKSIGYQQGHAGTSSSPYRVVRIMDSKSYGGQDCAICHRRL
ncbi:hypothetical protein K435DRAFT_513924 [Dendrothele bispora CBS 962.96]|uniref:Uncharacterized protein n=1 Tax=Dendrothele bispora (strain CBS 962.96) TaxID=1314807 RepID=A0A4S8M9A1_DENBC|nr:hypothetical protein K435DRAFT_513924 [Dendrothele bispora CBS 962.96]